MAGKKKISELPAAAAITGTELIEVVQSSVSSQSTVSDIAGSLVKNDAFGVAWDADSVNAASRGTLKTKIDTMDTDRGLKLVKTANLSDLENIVTARTSLGVEIGVNVQAFGAVLDDFNTLGASASDGQFIVATGVGAFAYESGVTARASMDVAQKVASSTNNAIVRFNGTTGEQQNSGVTIDASDNLVIPGNLTVSGTTTTVNSTTVEITDSLFKYAKDNNATDVLDIGWYGLYDTSGSLDLFAGMFRDAGDNKFHAFVDLQVEPTTTVNKAGAGYTVATLVANLDGTINTATQNSITTMTALATVGTITIGTWNGTDIAVADGGTGASTAPDARTNLGLGSGDSPTLTGLTLSGLTQGSVLFAGASSVISQDNANLFWDDTNNRFGIGTGSPLTTLQVKANTPGTVGDNPAGQIIIQALGTSLNANAVITGYNSDGSGNPNNQLWYLGSASGSNSNVTLLNRIAAASLSFGTNGSTRLSISGTGVINIVDLTASQPVKTDASKNLISGLIDLTTETSGLTEGSVPFGSATGTLAQANSDLFYDATNDRLGIGTSSPTHKLHVTSDSDPAIFESTSGNSRIAIDATSTNNSGIKFRRGGVLEWQIINQGTDDTFKFQNRDFATRMIIRQDGNVGIMTTSPQTNLHIQESNTDTVPTVEIEQLGTGDAALQFSIVGDSYAMGIDNSDDDKFKISYAAVAGTAVLGTNDRLTIDANGNMTIGGTATADNLKSHALVENRSPTASTTSTTFVTLQSASAVTFSGRPILCFVNVTMFPSTTDITVELAIQIDAGSDVVAAQLLHNTAVHNTVQGAVVVTPTAGSHTLRVRWRISGGTGTLTLDANDQILLHAVEL